MIEDVIVIDGVAHTYNLDRNNHASGRYSDAVSELVWGSCYPLSQQGYRVPRESFLRDWDIEETANMLFLESNTDLAVHHVLELNAYKDGLVSYEKTRAIKERWPDRFIVYAGVDPLRGKAALEDLERQVEVLKPVGLKLYPSSWGADNVRGWHMDDPEVAFPFFEKARELGLGTVAIHKAVPLGPIPMQHYKVDDIDRCADAFPDLNFEIVHGGMAFIEETAWQLARFPNVYVNIEILSALAVTKPQAFLQAMAGLISAGGPVALDKIIWGTGCMAFHPQPLLEAFWNDFAFPEELVNGHGLPRMDKEAKRKILGENFARMIGFDLQKAKQRTVGDEFDKKRKETGGNASPFSTTKVSGMVE
ncbi:amidohydrolase [Bacillus sp. M6-12]|uniref:amidohydrolase family protein n=1 Tax=Bacillus sp. M6-12 TaxID=2054166 RepID=UPI000C76DD51|nr:amidohydrolase family protein [Bacillus sp. M6-12]PLS18601.1 amidohydrolase [Bacillus sp. M6-12]